MSDETSQNSPDAPANGDSEESGSEESEIRSLTHSSARNFSLTAFEDQLPQAERSGENALNMRPSAAELFNDYPVVVPIQVRWGDMDAFGHVNNVLYFQYFEQARISFFRDTLPDFGGAPEGVGPILASTSAKFKAPVTYPDTLHVGVRVSDIGTDRFTMEFSIFSEELQRLAATGEALVVTYDYSAENPVPIPDAWRKAIA